MDLKYTFSELLLPSSESSPDDSVSSILLSNRTHFQKEPWVDTMQLAL